MQLFEYLSAIVIVKLSIKLQQFSYLMQAILLSLSSKFVPKKLSDIGKVSSNAHDQLSGEMEASF